MVKFTERHGEFELIYEASTIEELVALKNAVNPPILFAKEIVKDNMREIMSSIPVVGLVSVKSI